VDLFHLASQPYCHKRLMVDGGGEDGEAFAGIWKYPVGIETLANYPSTSILSGEKASSKLF
jgi:hypothetical protein